MVQGALDRLVDAARTDLEAAGSPAYLVAVVHGDGDFRLAPMVFSAPRPAREQAARLGPGHAPDDRVVVVARESDGRRAMFSVFDERVERRLHRRLEVVEPALTERDA